MNSRFLHGLQETASREEDQVQLIGKHKKRQLSTLDSRGINCPQHVVIAELSTEFQGNTAHWESVFGNRLKHSMSYIQDMDGCSFPALKTLYALPVYTPPLNPWKPLIFLLSP